MTVSFDEWQSMLDEYCTVMAKEGERIFAAVKAREDMLMDEVKRHQCRANTEAKRGAELERAVGAFLAYCTEESLNDNGPIARMMKALEPLRDWRRMDAR